MEDCVTCVHIIRSLKYCVFSYYIKSILKCNINFVLNLIYRKYNYENFSLKIHRVTTNENVGDSYLILI